jgi:predicted amidophosphoribosyltransferase
MDDVLRPLIVRARSLRAFIAATLRKMLRMERHDGDFASQRVCPFCGRITPRYETCCLECGNALKPAYKR